MSMREHHARCATHKGPGFWCDCVLWDGTSRFASADERETRMAKLIGEQAVRLVMQAGFIERLRMFASHQPHCALLAQMPMLPQRTYTFPKDWDDWRNALRCTCGLEELLK